MFGDLDRTPRTLLVCEKSSFRESNHRLSSQVEQLRFNYKVSVLLPDCSSTPSDLDDVLNSFQSFYLIKNLPVYELLDPDFLKTAVYQGSVYALSHRTRVDEDNCVALMPNGHLCLSLDKDSFQVLGFEGKPSRFTHRAACRYVVSVDLTGSAMAPGGRGYQRLVTGLRSRLQLRSDFLLSHHPGGGASLQALLSRYDSSELRPEVVQRSLSDLPRPNPRSCDPHDFLEWLGAVDASISCNNSSSSFLSSLSCPDPKTPPSQVLSVSVCGLICPQDVHRLIQHLRSHLERSAGESWASVTVHGFVDSPVSWGDEEHGVLRGGENFYTLLLFHDQAYRLYLCTGAQDICPP